MDEEGQEGRWKREEGRIKNDGRGTSVAPCATGTIAFGWDDFNYKREKGRIEGR